MLEKSHQYDKIKNLKAHWDFTYSQTILTQNYINNDIQIVDHAALKLWPSFMGPSSRPLSNIAKQDAREAMRVVFSVLTKRICMHKTNFLRIYSNIVLKVILICKLQLS